MSTIENYLQLWVIQEWEKENQALLRKKAIKNLGLELRVQM